MYTCVAGNKIPHNFDVLPPVTDHMIDVRTMEDLAGEEPPTSVLVQAHGTSLPFPLALWTG